MQSMSYNLVYVHHVVLYAWAISCQFSKMILTSFHMSVPKLLCVEVVELFGSPINPH